MAKSHLLLTMGPVFESATPLVVTILFIYLLPCLLNVVDVIVVEIRLKITTNSS